MNKSVCRRCRIVEKIKEYKSMPRFGYRKDDALLERDATELIDNVNSLLKQEGHKIVPCPFAELTKHMVYNNVPPENCPYVLEHIVSQ